MAKRGLKNFKRKSCSRIGKESWSLEFLDGRPVEAFDYFCESILDYPHSTQKRYAETVSRFIDYLFESKVFDTPVQRSHLNKVIDAYTTLLRDGSETTSKRVRESGRDLWLAVTADRLQWSPLMPNSLSNTIAAANAFLRQSNNLAREAKEKAAFFGIDLTTSNEDLIKSVSGHKPIGAQEVLSMKITTMFGNVAKFSLNGIRRAKGIRNSKGSGNANPEPDFPRDRLASLIENATSWRDKCFWLLLATLGIRTSEALNLRISDIDFNLQRIYIFDPSGTRASMGRDDPKRLRFKGREMVYTYPIPNLKKDLFYAIEKYLKLEFIPYSSNKNVDYLLQYVDAQHRGCPYVDASDTSMAQNFRKAVKRAGLSSPTNIKEWSKHSLRHMYGVFCLNDYPINPANNQFGLPIVDVQMMMGHKSINQTEKYARSKRRRLEAKLIASDLAILELSNEEMKFLPSFNLNIDKDSR